MKKLIQQLIGIGADLSTRNTLKAALKVLGIKPENIDKFYVELKNSINRDVFAEIPAKEKILFLPQCLRNGNCKAKMGKYGYECRDCCSCKAFRIKTYAEGLGYRVFIVPGGSMVLKIIEEFKPKAVAGIACLKELVLAMENIKLPCQGIELFRDGCRETDVSLDEVHSVLNGFK